MMLVVVTSYSFRLLCELLLGSIIVSVVFCRVRRVCPLPSLDECVCVCSARRSEPCLPLPGWVAGCPSGQSSTVESSIATECSR